MPEKKIEDQTYPLHSIYFYPTESCNLRCIHCWIEPGFAPNKKSYDYQNRENISVRDMEKVIADALPLGLSHIKLTGGEPLLHPDISEYIECFCKKGISYSIETNGTLLSEDVVKKLKQGKLKQISISLDGSYPETHERIRGVKGCFQKTVEGVTLLVKNGISPQVIFCLMRINADDLEKTIELADRLGVRSFEINPVSLLGGRSSGKNGPERLSVEELIDFEKRIEHKLARRFPDMHINLYLPPAFKGMKELSRYSMCKCNIHGICGLLSNGDVSICGIGRREKSLIMGNIREKGIVRIWKEGLIFEEIRDKVPFQMTGICGNCLFKHHCLGFCRADLLSQGRPVTDSHYLCEEMFQKGFFPESRILSHMGIMKTDRGKRA